MKPDMVSELAGDGTKGFLTIEPERMSMLNGMTLGALRKNKMMYETPFKYTREKVKDNSNSSEGKMSYLYKEDEYTPTNFPSKYNPLYYIAKEEFKGHEGTTDYVYLDTTGHRSIGTGININDKKDFLSTPLKKRDSFATQNEKQDCYDEFDKLIKKKEYGKPYSAEHFKDTCDLRIDMEDADKIYSDRLGNHINILNNRFPYFYSLPLEQQLVYLDLQFNTGHLRKKYFKNFLEAAENHDVARMAQHVNRPDVSPSRTKWIQNILLNGYFSK